ncbi:MAG: 6-bladed beta-propeller [bacterium]
MKHRTGTLWVLLVGLASGLLSIFSLVPTDVVAEQSPEAPRIDNPATPRDGHLTLEPRELWRQGGEDEEILFGFVITALDDEAGNVYLLDRQLATVFVFSPAGEYLHNLSREGEGPGETRLPTDMLWLPDGSLGLVQSLPGKIVKVDRSGDPAGVIVLGGDTPGAGGMCFLSEARCRSGGIVCCGARALLGQDGLVQNRFLATFDEHGAEAARFLELRDRDVAGTKIREADSYWVVEGRWCLGPDGSIYTAPRRDEYAVHVFAPDGHLERIFAREFRSWRRTQQEKDRLRSRWAGRPDETDGQRDVEIADVDPCLEQLRVADDGTVWIRHSRSARQQLSGVMVTYDVFDPAGQFVRTVSLVLPGDAFQDKLVFLSNDRLLLIRGFRDASRALFGDSPEDQAAAESPLEVICYALDGIESAREE